MTEVNADADRSGTCPAGFRPAYRIRPDHRVWLRDQGTPVFGVGICELLARVEATGSLRRAASDMGMAYSKAWQIVRRAEEHLGFQLMIRHTGGKGGGCSILSEEGRWLVGAFGAFAEEADTLVDELFAKHFANWHRAAGDLRMDVAAESLREDGA